MDVFDMNDKFLASIGAVGYSDYPTYLAKGDKALADARRTLYVALHTKYRSIAGSAGYYANSLLWCFFCY